jgi:hypothetical protein
MHFSGFPSALYCTFGVFLNRLFYNPHKAPTLGFTIRAALRNFNNITYTSLLVLVVDTKFCSAFYIFSVSWMPDLEVNGNFDAFGTTIAHYNAGYRF